MNPFRLLALPWCLRLFAEGITRGGHLRSENDSGQWATVHDKDAGYCNCGISMEIFGV